MLAIILKQIKTNLFSDDMKKFLMRGKTIAIVGVLSWVLGVLASTTDDGGNFVAPIFIIGLSGIMDFVFIILAVVRLWKTERFLSIALIFSTIALSILSAIQEVTLPKYGSPIILLTNIVKVVDFIIFAYTVCLLWAKSKYEEASVTP